MHTHRHPSLRRGPLPSSPFCLRADRPGEAQPSGRAEPSALPAEWSGASGRPGKVLSVGEARGLARCHCRRHPSLADGSKDPARPCLSSRPVSGLPLEKRPLPGCKTQPIKASWSKQVTGCGRGRGRGPPSPCSVAQAPGGSDLVQGEGGVGSAPCPRVTRGCHRRGPRPRPGPHSAGAGRCSQGPRQLLPKSPRSGILPGPPPSSKGR